MLYKTLITASLAIFAISSADLASAAGKKGVSGRYYCGCFSDDTAVAGTCSTQSTGTCGKNSGDTCTATCKMVTFTTGVTGGSIAKQSSGAVEGVLAPKIAD